MTKQLIIPKPGGPVDIATILNIEKNIADILPNINNYENLEELRKQAQALATYVRNKEMREPMLGAERRIEARIGQLLGEPKHGGDRRSDGFQDHHDELEKIKHDQDRSDFRLLARAYEDDLLEWDEWRKARRSLINFIKIKLGLISEKDLSPEHPPIITLADYKEWLPKQEQCDLLLTDPPYATDVNDVHEFAEEWLPVALGKIKPTGRAYIFIGAYPEELHAYLSVSIPTQVLVWSYRNTLGPSPTQTYKLNWQAILYYEMPDAPPLNCPKMTEQFSVQDINAPDGRQGNRYHTWQKPSEIAERFIRHSTHEDDLVLDPFCCTGTFILEASKLKRFGLGCDINQDAIDLAVMRGCKNG
jgi:hypothetical protein